MSMVAFSTTPTPRTFLSWLPFLWSRVLFPAPPSPAESLHWRHLLLLLLLPAVALYPCLSFHLFEPDEGRYAQIPREMLQRGEWIVPTLHGEPYLDKPPLFYWLVMLSYTVFGTSDAAARFIPALALHGCLLVLYFFGRRWLGERVAFWGALMLSMTPGFVGVARLLLLDGVLTFLVLLGLCSGFEAVRGSQFRWKWWYLTILACGLGLLSKGPVILVLVLPPLWLHGWLTRGGSSPRASGGSGVASRRDTRCAEEAKPLPPAPSRLRGGGARHSEPVPEVGREEGENSSPPPRFGEGAGGRGSAEEEASLTSTAPSPPAPLPWLPLLTLLLGAALLALPWYVAICRQIPDFATYFFWQHNVQRFVDPFDHQEPVWYYLPILLVSLMPMTLLLWPLARWLFWSTCNDPGHRSPELGFLLLAASWCVLFFSLSGCKLPTYILPAYPPLVLALAAVLVQRRWHVRYWTKATAVALYGVMILCHFVVVPWYAHSRSPMGNPEEVREYCADPGVPVVCYPRNVDSVAFYLGRADFRTFRSKYTPNLIEMLGQQPQTVILFSHRTALQRLHDALPPELRLARVTKLGLCSMAVVERLSLDEESSEEAGR